LDKTTTDFSSEEKERLLLSDDEEQRTLSFSLSLSLFHVLRTASFIVRGCAHVAFLQKQTVFHAPNRRRWSAPFTKETESDGFPMCVGGV
jgi:hypothetical protein